LKRPIKIQWGIISYASSCSTPFLPVLLSYILFIPLSPFLLYLWKQWFKLQLFPSCRKVLNAEMPLVYICENYMFPWQWHEKHNAVLLENQSKLLTKIWIIQSSYFLLSTCTTVITNTALCSPHSAPCIQLTYYQNLKVKVYNYMKK
jgi:hypothetical protein